MLKRNLKWKDIPVIFLASKNAVDNESNTAIIEEMSTLTEQLSAVVNDISSEIIVLRILSDELIDTISIFKL